MENFIYSIPTEIYFGKGQIANIGRIVSGYVGRHCWFMVAAVSSATVFMMML